MHSALLSPLIPSIMSDDPFDSFPNTGSRIRPSEVAHPPAPLESACANTGDLQPPPSGQPALAPAADTRESAATASNQPQQAFICTPVRGATLSTTNQHALDPKIGKDRGLSLVNQSGGMIKRLHELPIQHMLDVIVGGETPTDEVRKKYRYHSVKRVKRESGLYWRVVSSFILVLLCVHSD